MLASKLQLVAEKCELVACSGFDHDIMRRGDMRTAARGHCYVPILRNAQYDSFVLARGSRRSSIKALLFSNKVMVGRATIGRI